ncbi:hypothetical protein VD0002_g5475 [Verticillium dahliae]|nr:hypothetical protein VD0002_g5475 [Verticillium dahliae]
MASLRCANPASSAGLFVQLARRTTTTTATPVLDILAPRWSRQTARLEAAYSTTTHRAWCDKHPATINTITNSRGRVLKNVGQRRAFSHLPARQATACVHNLQVDEDGKEMRLEITDRAGKRLLQIMKKDKNPDLALRIQVESGGCHGFQYLMSLVPLPPAEGSDGNVSAAVGEDDSIFEYAEGEEYTATSPTPGAPKIVLDQPSLDLLKGSKVDFTMELIGSQFKIADNPLATSSCGCGTSFDIKM